MKRVGIIPKEPKNNDFRAVKLAERICLWLHERKVQPVLPDLTKGIVSEESARVSSFFAKAAFFSQVDLAVVLGGDGTLLSVARMEHSDKVPIIGVHLGEFGFIMEVTESELFDLLHEVLAGHYKVSKRTLLRSRVIRNGEETATYDALNDVVVTKGALARINVLDVKVNQIPTYTLRADGMIVSTPTGSTAYSLAAGGPLVTLESSTFVLTPICPHTLSLRPLIIPDSSEVEIHVSRVEEDVILTVDGQVGFSLAKGDKILNGKSHKEISLIVSPHRTYYDILRAKLNWG